MRYLDRLHPVCAFVYFACVIAVSMLTQHPAVVTVCALMGMTLYGVLCGARRLLTSLKLSLPLFVLMALLNPIFSHKGSTVVLFLNDNPVTLEATVYGIFSAAMLVAVLYWFACLGEIMTSDKLIYLFGRIIPRLSLLLSMTLAAVPRLRRQYREILDAQMATGLWNDESYTARLRLRLLAVSALTSRALEGSIDTADSMRARGYGLRGRTAYSLYRFTPSDAVVLALTLVLGGTVAALSLVGAADFSYYPVLGFVPLATETWVMEAALLLLCGIPILMEVKEMISWHISRSNI